VKYVDVGTFPQARRAFQVTRCNQCEHAPCVTACPTSAMFERADGIVDFDKSICIGCKACIAACPYDAIFINPEDHSAEKCNFCAHRLDIGLEPACVVVCPTQAILVGDMDDPASAVSRLIHREATAVRRPEKETGPKLYYRGAHQATLDPLAARRPDGGLYMWSEQGSGPGHVGSGRPDYGTSSAAALLSYDIPHKAPWDARVSLYTWTKSIAAGSYLAGALAAVLGVIGWTDPLWTVVVPALALFFLAATGGLLIWDLEHPGRFALIFLRPQWRSWLVRGGFIIGAYGAVLAAHAGAVLLGRPEWTAALAWAGVPLAAGTAVYTAWLFAQAKARDLWQSPLLPPHLAVQALVAGSAALGLAARAVGAEPATSWLDMLFVLSTAAHLLMVGGEAALPQPTAHARLAHHELVAGRFGLPFRASIALGLLALATPWVGAVGVIAGLVALLLYEHAYVQAGQSVPLA
jgi:Fe-S-cluster-containing dehydrogenase component